MGVNISSLELLHKDLGKAGPKAIERTKMVIKKIALDIEGNAKQIAPVGTGNLKSSIGHSDLRLLSAEHMLVDIGPTASYGTYLEHGTSRQAPQAFMGPSSDRFAPTFAKAMEQLGAEAMDG